MQTIVSGGQNFYDDTGIYYSTSKINIGLEHSQKKFAHYVVPLKKISLRKKMFAIRLGLGYCQQVGVRRLFYTKILQGKLLISTQKAVSQVKFCDMGDFLLFLFLELFHVTPLIGQQNFLDWYFKINAQLKIDRFRSSRPLFRCTPMHPTQYFGPRTWCTPLQK